MENMSLGVLISSMNQTDFDLINSSNLKEVNTIIINQNGEEKTVEKGIHKMICTSSKGLSKSRNIALDNSIFDISVISDDDETFFDNMEELVRKGYDNNPKADIIVFKIKNLNKRYFKKAKRLSKYELLKVSSVQITFKTKAIKDAQIRFNEKLGAGTGNGAGEENKFLLDCYKKGLKIYFVPVEIGQLNESESSWFHGYTDKWFYNRGMSTRYILGFFISIFYAFFDIAKRWNVYKAAGNPLRFLRIVLKGIFENKLKD